MRTKSLTLVFLSLVSMDAFGQSVIVVTGEDNQVVVTNSQNVTSIDARQWHYTDARRVRITDARQWHKTTVEIERAPMQRYLIPAVTTVVVDPAPAKDRLCVVFDCGKSFRTIFKGREVRFDLVKGPAVYDPPSGRFQMEGFLWQGSVNRLWYFTSNCPDGITRTWLDP